jgi:hypothetical protein
LSGPRQWGYVYSPLTPTKGQEQKRGSVDQTIGLHWALYTDLYQHVLYQ